MKLKKPEIIIISITLAFACFTGGYFAGRADAPGVVTISPERAAAESLPGGVTDTTEPDSGGADNKTPALTTGEAPDQTPGQVEADSVFFGKININKASRDELTDLPNIGEVMAQRIIDYREATGGFKSVEEIMLVDGIGEKRFEAMKDFITIE